MRRWLIGLGIVLVVSGLVVGTGWFVVLPRWRPPMRRGERLGVDVASHQGAIDWASVADDRISFAYIKATEGRDFVDPTFTSNWKGSAAAGIDRGAYHFFTLCSSGSAQAQHFLSVVPPDRRALAPAVDLEVAGNCGARPSTASVRRQLSAFMTKVEAAWRRSIVLYVGSDWNRRYPTMFSRHRPVWVRRIVLRPSERRWAIWQVQGTARIHGIQGQVDLDIMRPQRQ